MADVSVGARRTGPPPWAVVLGFGLLVVAGLVWAKWAPYWVKVPSVAGSHSLGPSIVTAGEPVPPGVSLTAGLRFAGTYFVAIWPALVVGLVLAAAVQVALPPAWLRRLFVAGTLLPIPTGAEIAVVAAVLAVGIPAPLAAALLITLPALSLPSLLMVRGVFPRRLLAAVTGLVVGVGTLTSVFALGL
jgi:uncharacterized protein